MKRAKFGEIRGANLVVWFMPNQLADSACTWEKLGKYHAVLQIPGFRVIKWVGCNLPEQSLPEVKVLTEWLPRKGADSKLTNWVKFLVIWNAINYASPVDEGMSVPGVFPEEQQKTGGLWLNGAGRELSG